MASSRIQVEKLHVFLTDIVNFLWNKSNNIWLKVPSYRHLYLSVEVAIGAHKSPERELIYLFFFFGQKTSYFGQGKQFSWWSKTWGECCRARCSSHWTGPRRLSAWSRWTRTCCWCPWWWQAARWQGLSDKVLRVECPDTKWHRGESVLPGSSSSSSSSSMLPRHKSSTVRMGNDFHLLESASIMSWAIPSQTCWCVQMQSLIGVILL